MCVSLLLFSSICTVVGASVTVSGYRGETLDIRCSYLELSGTEYPKFFCKGECYFGFENVIVGSGSPAKDQRFSVNDDKTNRVFTVTITDLRTEDAGQYWCALEDGGLFRRAFMEILVYVHRAPKKPKPVQISASTINSDQALSSSSHTWPDLSSSAVNPQSTISTFTDHHVSSDSFMIIITAEASVLLLIGLPLLILAVRQRKKTDGLHSSEFTTSIYQQMKDNPADRDTHTTVCYSCV
ncbi:CMRF35-like molecule 8 isoform X2 [Danio rerio]|uniref:CMRF35-like molecule 8 isoform X2 n=1 Tax=Danio rerio TaxID=7955 RepID=A0AC58G2Y4_DANRE